MPCVNLTVLHWWKVILKWSEGITFPFVKWHCFCVWSQWPKCIHIGMVNACDHSVWLLVLETADLFAGQTSCCTVMTFKGRRDKLYSPSFLGEAGVHPWASKLMECGHCWTPQAICRDRRKGLGSQLGFTILFLWRQKMFALFWWWQICVQPWGMAPCCLKWPSRMSSGAFLFGPTEGSADTLLPRKCSSYPWCWTEVPLF